MERRLDRESFTLLLSKIFTHEILERVLEQFPEGGGLMDDVREELEKAIVESGDRLLPFFRFSHLPDGLQGTSQQFASLAITMVTTIPQNAERTVALRKLLESKDCAVRALL
jgi:hypothetical protein